MANRKTYDLDIKISGKVDGSLKHATDLTKRQLNALLKDYAGVKTGNQGLLDVAKKDFATLDAGYAKLEAGLGRIAKATAVAAGAVGAFSLKVGSDFEAQMSTVEAISGATASQMALLEDKAKSLGISTKFSATEVGQAYQYMGMAGWSAEQMLQGIPGILALAAASGEDLATVSDIVTDDLTAFGMAAEDAGHFADVLAAAATNSNTNVALMGETFSYAAPLAGAMGYSVEDLAVATGLMANSSIKGSQAGTALRNIITRLAKPTKDSAEAMDALGLSLTDDEGNMKSFGEIMDDMREGFSGLDEQQKAYYATSLAGKHGLSGLLAIVNASEADYTKLSDAIKDADGAAQQMADIKIDNLQGDLTLAKSAAEGLGIELYDIANGVLRDVVQGGAGMIQDLASGIKADGPTIQRTLGDIAEMALDFADPLLDAGRFFLKNPKALVTPIAGIGAAMATYKLASTANSIVQSMAALSALGPAGMAVLGGTALVGALTAIQAYHEMARDERANASLAEHFGDITLSAQDLEQSARYILGGDSLTAVDAISASLAKADQHASGMAEAARSLDKYDWKVSIGLGLNEAETADYQQQIETYAKEAQAWVDENHYSVTMGVQFLFNGNEAQGEFQEAADQYFADRGQQIKSKAAGLAWMSQRYGADGTIDAREQANMSRLRQEIADLQNGLMSDQFNAQKSRMMLDYGYGNLSAGSFKNLMAELGTISGDALSKSAASYEQLKQLPAFSSSEMQAQLDAAYLTQNADWQGRIIGTGIETLKGTYGEELDSAARALAGAFSSSLAGAMSNPASFMTDASGNAQWQTDAFSLAASSMGASLGGDQDAIRVLWEQMAPSADELTGLAGQFKALGLEIPESITEGLQEYYTLGAAAGDESSIYYMMGKQLAEDPQYETLLTQIQESGLPIPESLYNGIVAASPDTMAMAAQQMRTDAEGAISSAFADPLNVPISFNVRLGSGEIASKPAPHADGGIFSTPHVGLVAEAGPEAIIPLNGSENAMGLWQKAGELLGAGSAGGINITFAPVQTFNGPASQSDVETANRNSLAEMRDMITRILREDARYAYGGA